MIRLRASALPRVNACTASAKPPAIAIDLPSDAADLGSAVHESVALKIKGADVDFAEIAAKWGVDADELKKLAAIAWGAWCRYQHHFVDPVTEHEFVPLTWGRADLEDVIAGRALAVDLVQLTGHADMLSISPDGSTVYILDWKTGWADNDHDQQLRGYGLLALNEVATATKVVTIVFKLRLGLVEVVEHTREALVAWWDDLASRVVSRPDVYSPSPSACGFCPRFSECPARSQMVREAAHQMGLASQEIVDHLSPMGLVALYERAKDVARCAALAVDLVRARVIADGGRTESPDGRELTLTTTVQTRIDFPAGEDVLREHCGDQLGQCLTVRKTNSKSDPEALGVENIIRERAGRGKGKAAVERFYIELDQASALKLVSVEKLELRKAPKLVEAQ